MIIRGCPIRKEFYIKVNSYTSEILHSCGFSPKYIDDEYIYYVKDICLEKFMEREGLKECQ